MMRQALLVHALLSMSFLLNQKLRLKMTKIFVEFGYCCLDCYSLLLMMKNETTLLCEVGLRVPVRLWLTIAIDFVEV